MQVTEKEQRYLRCLAEGSGLPGRCSLAFSYSAFVAAFPFTM